MSEKERKIYAFILPPPWSQDECGRAYYTNREIGNYDPETWSNIESHKVTLIIEPNCGKSFQNFNKWPTLNYLKLNMNPLRFLRQQAILKQKNAVIHTFYTTKG